MNLFSGDKMLPRHFMYYTFRTPLCWFGTFLTAYVLGRMRIGFMASFYKLLIFLAVLFLLHIILSKVRRRYFDEGKRKRPIRVRAPQEYYDRMHGTGTY